MVLRILKKISEYQNNMKSQEQEQLTSLLKDIIGDPPSFTKLVSDRKKVEK